MTRIKPGQLVVCMLLACCTLEVKAATVVETPESSALALMAFGFLALLLARRLNSK